MTIRKLITTLVIALLAQSIKAQTLYLPLDTVAPTIITYNLSGGAFQSYGCDGLDPTYWVSENGNTVEATFVNPQTNPSFRVWGMNDDDSAQISVNGTHYPLTSNSAAYNTKVVCSAVHGSPGPDGVLFSSGLLVGANTNNEGNYSYQDVTLLTTNVNSLKVEGLSGNGWGIDGITIAQEITNIQLQQNTDMSVELFPNPVTDVLTINGFLDKEVTIELWNLLGESIFQVEGANGKSMSLGLSHIAKGTYFLTIRSNSESITRKVIKQ